MVFAIERFHCTIIKNAAIPIARKDLEFVNLNHLFVCNIQSIVEYGSAEKQLNDITILCREQYCSHQIFRF